MLDFVGFSSDEISVKWEVSPAQFMDKTLMVSFLASLFHGEGFSLIESILSLLSSAKPTFEVLILDASRLFTIYM